MEVAAGKASTTDAVSSATDLISASSALNAGSSAVDGAKAIMAPANAKQAAKQMLDDSSVLFRSWGNVGSQMTDVDEIERKVDRLGGGPERRRRRQKKKEEAEENPEPEILPLPDFLDVERPQMRIADALFDHGWMQGVWGDSWEGLSCAGGRKGTFGYGEDPKKAPKKPHRSSAAEFVKTPEVTKIVNDLAQYGPYEPTKHLQMPPSAAPLLARRFKDQTIHELHRDHDGEVAPQSAVPFQKGHPGWSDENERQFQINEARLHDIFGRRWDPRYNRTRVRSRKTDELLCWGDGQTEYDADAPPAAELTAEEQRYRTAPELVIRIASADGYNKQVPEREMRPWGRSESSIQNFMKCGQAVMLEREPVLQLRGHPTGARQLYPGQEYHRFIHQRNDEVTGRTNDYLQPTYTPQASIYQKPR